MEPLQSKTESVITPLKKVTPLSKYLAMTLFVALPFLGAYVGYTFAPEKVLEVEHVVIRDESKLVTSSESKVEETGMSAVQKDVDDVKLPFGTVAQARAYLDGTEGLSDEILDRQYPSDMLIDNVGPRLPGERYNISAVSEYNNVNNCWVIQNNRVYDITALLPLKTFFAALGELENMCGKDITGFVESKPVTHGSLNTARFSYPLAEFFIGAIE